MKKLPAFTLLLLCLHTHLLAADLQFVEKSFTIGSTTVVMPVPRGFKDLPRESMDEYIGEEKFNILLDGYKEVGIGLRPFYVELRIAIAERDVNQSISEEEFVRVLYGLENELSNPRIRARGKISILSRKKDVLIIYATATIDAAQAKIYSYHTSANIRIKGKHVNLTYSVKSASPDSAFELFAKDHMQEWCDAILASDDK